MSLRWLCTGFRRLPEVYGHWLAQSHLALVESARLLNAARDGFDQARTVRSDDVPWCRRCEWLSVHEGGSGAMRRRGARFTGDSAPLLAPRESQGAGPDKLQVLWQRREFVGKTNFISKATR